ncbi:MAG: hypothetical protein A2542_01040 [Parcubacteria group bacterium RIFOXYD2_FULL_52_8]|nr:MAG: hypothetical protein A2542_01040 [Parcubacteria group bacterium RIFOXYD2_FULL_52_8]
MPEYSVTIPFVLALINGVLAVLILLGKRDSASQSYALFVTFVAAWCLSIGLVFYWERTPLAIVAINFNYIAAAGTVLLFLIFTKFFPRRTWDWYTISIVSLPLLALGAYLALDPHLIIKTFVSRSEFTIGYTAYAAYTLTVYYYILWAFYSLYRSYRQSTEVDERGQTAVVAIGTTCGYLVVLFPNIVLPWYLDYAYIWIGPIASLIMTLSIAYAISKHHLFDVKVIATEIMTFLLWLLLLFRIAFSTTYGDTLLNVLVFVFATIFGVLLIKSVLREVETRERVELLAKDLELANARLKELDQQKSEFVSIASHQLRSPLTAIKGYTSMLLEDTASYGNIHKGVITTAGVDALDRVFKSANNLVAIIEDLLNISRIEQGRMQYTMTEFSLSEMVRELVENLAINAKERGLTISFHDANIPVTISADSGKIRQVINNIIDNSIKYTPAGSIAVALGVKDGKPLLVIQDTGIGISQANIGKLFQKFSRASGAGKVNVTGTGIGLFIAQEIMRAHKGRIWVESPGEGKGSTFFIEFAALETAAASVRH